MYARDWKIGFRDELEIDVEPNVTKGCCSTDDLLKE